MSRKLDDWMKLVYACAERGIEQWLPLPRGYPTYGKHARVDDPLYYMQFLSNIQSAVNSSRRRLPVDGDPYNFNLTWWQHVQDIQTYILDVGSSNSSYFYFDSALTDTQAQVFLDSCWSLLEYAYRYFPVNNWTMTYYGAGDSWQYKGSCGHNVPYTPPPCEANLPNFDIGETIQGARCNNGSSATIRLDTWQGEDSRIACVLGNVNNDLANVVWDDQAPQQWNVRRDASHSIGVYSQGNEQGTWRRAEVNSSASGTKVLVRPHINVDCNYRKGKIHLYCYANNLYLDDPNYTERWGFTEANKLRKIAEYSFDKPQVKTYFTPIEFSLDPITPDALSAIPAFNTWCPDGSNGSWSDSKGDSRIAIPLQFVTWLEIEYLTHKE